MPILYGTQATLDEVLASVRDYYSTLTLAQVSDNEWKFRTHDGQELSGFRVVRVGQRFRLEKPL